MTAVATFSKAIPVQSLEKTRDDLVVRAKNNPELSKEIVGMIQLIAQEAATTELNRIITLLNDGYYVQQTLPVAVLTNHLKQAGLALLASEIGQRRFNDPALNPPRGDREAKFRHHETL